MEMAAKNAAAEGTPFVSFFLPGQITALAARCGLKNPKVITAEDFKRLYFMGRSDDLTLVRGEEVLVATVG
jgi:O-methyltransferase involved in polyketide biosynthesis